MSYNTLIDTVVTTLDSVTGVNYCERAALIDPSRILEINRFPHVTVTDLGGQLDPFSGTIYERVLGITIAVNRPRGTVGKKASQQMETVAAAITTALANIRIGSTFMMVADSAEIAESGTPGEEIYLKTLAFTYDIVG